MKAPRMSIPSIARALFTKATAVDGLKIRSYVGGTVRGVTLRGGQKVLTQNPATGSRFAAMAKSGKKVAWLIGREKTYVGAIIDGRPLRGKELARAGKESRT